MSEARTCPVCDGSGVIEVGDEYEVETFECRLCAGTGLAGAR